MLSSINSTMKKIWKKMTRKGYRDSFVSAHISNTVSSQIAMLRERAGWTQTQLADRVGMKQSRISALEDPNYENYETKTLLRIASAFDVALTVRFTPFSELARWSSGLSDDNLIVSKFEDDNLDNALAKGERHKVDSIFIRVDDEAFRGASNRRDIEPSVRITAAGDEDTTGIVHTFQ
jgi:transcriptional regulator with XRE-family HTH domain